jgi:excisionase family DNA binding protein
MLGDDPLLTVPEVARALRVSSMTIYRLINEGELGALRIGGSWRLRTSAVERFLAAAAGR